MRGAIKTGLLGGAALTLVVLFFLAFVVATLFSPHIWQILTLVSLVLTVLNLFLTFVLSVGVVGKFLSKTEWHVADLSKTFYGSDSPLSERSTEGAAEEEDSDVFFSSKDVRDAADKLTDALFNPTDEVFTDSL